MVEAIGREDGGKSILPPIFGPDPSSRVSTEEQRRMSRDTFSKNLEIFERLPQWCLAVIWEKSRDSRGIRERIRGSRHEALTRRVTRELNTGLATLSLSAQEGKGKVAISESSGRVFNMLIVYLR